MTTNNIGSLSIEPEEFLGRMIRLLDNDDVSRQNAVPAKLISVDKKNGRAEVKPARHKSTEVVPLDCIGPWWSKNPDLREKNEAQTQEEPMKTSVTPQKQDQPKKPAPKETPAPERDVVLPYKITLPSRLTPKVMGKMKELIEAARAWSDAEEMATLCRDELKAKAESLQEVGATIEEVVERIGGSLSFPCEEEPLKTTPSKVELPTFVARKRAGRGKGKRTQREVAVAMARDILEIASEHGVFDRVRSGDPKAHTVLVVDNNMLRDRFCGRIYPKSRLIEAAKSAAKSSIMNSTLKRIGVRIRSVEGHEEEKLLAFVVRFGQDESA